MNTVITRPVEEQDLDGLAALEARVWKRRHAPILTRKELAEWYDERSPYFIVAEDPDGICGYYFGRQIAFSPDRLDAFLDPALITGRGLSNHPHDPSQDSVYGISVVAEVPGVGALLNDAVHELLEVMGIRYFVGFTRLSRLSAYLEYLERTGPLPYDEELIAQWYAHESATLLRMPRWEQAEASPSLASLPPLRRPDPVLAFHVQGTTFGLLAVLPNYMEDPASRNYGACIASGYPHRF